MSACYLCVCVRSQFLGRLANVSVPNTGQVNFDKLDHDNAGSIGTIDLVRVLAKTDSMSFEKAYSIAHTILKEADQKQTNFLGFPEYFSVSCPSESPLRSG